MTPDTILEQLKNTLSYFEKRDLVDTYAQLKGDIDKISNKEQYVMSYIKYHGYDDSLLSDILHSQALIYQCFDSVPLDVWTSPEVMKNWHTDFKNFAFKRTGNKLFRPDNKEQTEQQFYVFCQRLGDFLNKSSVRYNKQEEDVNLMEDIRSFLHSPDWISLVEHEDKVVLYKIMQPFFMLISRYDSHIPYELTSILKDVFVHPRIMECLKGTYQLTFPWGILAYIPHTKELPFNLYYSYSIFGASLAHHPELYDVLPNYMPYLKKLRSLDISLEKNINIFRMQSLAQHHKEFQIWWNKITNKLTMYQPYIYFGVVPKEKYRVINDYEPHEYDRFERLYRKILPKHWGDYYQIYLPYVMEHYKHNIMFDVPIKNSCDTMLLSEWLTMVEGFKAKQTLDVTEEQLLI